MDNPETPITLSTKDSKPQHNTENKKKIKKTEEQHGNILYMHTYNNENTS
jgi:hypothetical protein